MDHLRVIALSLICGTFVISHGGGQHAEVHNREKRAMVEDKELFNPRHDEEDGEGEDGDVVVEIDEKNDNDDDNDDITYYTVADGKKQGPVKAEQHDHKQALSDLAQQVMMMQFQAEERIRSEGGSGLKQVRSNRGGTQPYYYATHTENSVASIHNHANHINTVGMGEFIAVLNGVEFRTRHNDYRLKQPHSTSTAYHETEEIEFPQVPPEVLNQETLEGQINEMKLWFKAFKDQDYKVRDYRKYFKPVLCYLEGAWTLGNKNIEESFDSDRHFLDASSWLDMLEKVHFTSSTGRKSQRENYAFLPTSLVGMKNGTVPVFAQWNYRILCHKLKKDVPTGKFRAADDLASRFANRYTFDKYLNSRAARFQIHDPPKHIDMKENVNMLDDLMSEIPGKDNYKGQIFDTAFGYLVYDYDGVKPKNAAYYHRVYRVQSKDAMGLNSRRRGFSDPSLFVALTNQEKVAPVGYKQCHGRRRNRYCYKVLQRVSYAIPLEIIYMTPLMRWNPYNITYKGNYKSTEAKSVYLGGRNGKKNETKAYNGTHSKLYYRTPAAFFATKRRGERMPADTVRNSVGILNSTGDMNIVTASGTFIVLPEIDGVGTVRLRYPIMPVHAEGNAIWKELQALKESVMHMERNIEMFADKPPLGGVLSTPATREVTYTFYTSLSHRPDLVDNHYHTFTMFSYDYTELTKNAWRDSREYTTSYDNGHEHRVRISYFKFDKKFHITRCDGMKRCRDRHDNTLTYEQD